jgi:hypothetical protein
MDEEIALLANPSKVAFEGRPRGPRGEYSASGSDHGSDSLRSDASDREHGMRIPRGESPGGDVAGGDGSDGGGDDSDGGGSEGPGGRARAVAPTLSSADVRQSKFRMLHDMDEWERRGHRLPRRHTMSSPYEEVAGDYDYVKRTKAQQNSVRVQKQVLVTVVSVIEMANNAIDPFGVDLEGWGDHFGSNIDDFDDVLVELHDTYQSRVSVAPEVRMIMMMGMSILAFKQAKQSSTPEFDEVMQSNPDLARAYASAASSCAGKRAGLGGRRGASGGLGSGLVMNLVRGMMPGPAAAAPRPQSDAGDAPPGGSMRGPRAPASRAQEVIDFLDKQALQAHEHEPQGSVAGLFGVKTAGGALHPAQDTQPSLDGGLRALHADGPGGSESPHGPGGFLPPDRGIDTRVSSLPPARGDMIEVMSGSTVSVASSRKGRKGVTISL